MVVRQHPIFVRCDFIYYFTSVCVQRNQTGRHIYRKYNLFTHRQLDHRVVVSQCSKIYADSVLFLSINTHFMFSTSPWKAVIFFLGGGGDWRLNTCTTAPYFEYILYFSRDVQIFERERYDIVEIIHFWNLVLIWTTRIGRKTCWTTTYFVLEKSNHTNRTKYITHGSKSPGPNT